MDQAPLNSWAGGLGAAVGKDQVIAIYAAAQTVTELFPTVATAPSTGTTIVEIRNDATGESIAATIPVGEQSPASPASGLINIAAGDVLIQQVTQDGGARDLSGYYTRTGAGVAPPLVVDLTTLSIVKRAHGITTGAHDAEIGDLITWTSQRIRRYCDRTLTQTVITGEEHDGDGDRWLIPREYPIVSVEELRVFDDPQDPTAYHVNSARNAIEPDLANWPRGRRALSIDYTAGHTTVPEDLIDAATLQVRREYQRTHSSGSNNLGVESSRAASGGDITAETSSRALLPEVREMLAPYRRMSA